MAAGRHAPEEFEPPSVMEACLSSQEVAPERYCDGAVSSTRHLIADRIPSGLRILADDTGSLSR